MILSNKYRELNFEETQKSFLKVIDCDECHWI
jgi:hypothetical protein